MIVPVHNALETTYTLIKQPHTFLAVPIYMDTLHFHAL